MRLRPIIAVASLVTSVVASGSIASAQQETSVVEGAGYEVSEGTVLHPNVSVRTGVINNVFYTDTDFTTAPILDVVGRFAIASEHNEPDAQGEAAIDPLGTDTAAEKPAPDLDFRLTGHLGYVQYLSGNSAVTKQSDLRGGFDGAVVSAPRGSFSLFARNKFERSNRPRNYFSFGNIDRDTNHLRAGARWKPGHGALQFTARYENLLDYFEEGNRNPEFDGFANRMNHTLGVRGEWQFLPITRFFADVSYGFFGQLGDRTPKVSSTPLRVRLGGASAITEATTLRVHIGYGNGFYSAGQNFQNVLFGTEFGLRYSPMGRFTVAYNYDFDDSIQANFYRDHALIGRLDQQIRRVLIEAQVQVRLRAYRQVLMSLGPNPSRDDLLLYGLGKAHFIYRDWLAFTGEVRLITDQTDYRDNQGDDPSYSRLEAYLGATAAF